MKKTFKGAIVASLTILLAAPAFADPQVTVKSGKFESAKEKKAVKALRMKSGYKGDAEARELGNKLFRAAKKSENVALKGDKSNALQHVSKSDPAGHFRIDKTTGDFSFHKGFKDYVNDRSTANLPSKDGAPEVAKKHLAALGLLPDKQEEMVVKHVGGINQVDLKDGKVVGEFKKIVTVHFGRQIDGIDVGGPGSKIVVDLGANGDLVGVHKRWIEYVEEPKTDAEIKGQSEVVSDLRSKVRNEASKAKKADTTAPDFGYYDDGKGNIEPAYFFVADLEYDSTDEEGKPKAMKEKYLGVVPALKNSKADFKQLEKAEKNPNRSNQPTGDDRPSRKD